MKEVGTFWELEGHDIYYIIIGKFDTHNTALLYDNFSKTMENATLNEEVAFGLVPSRNLEINMLLLEELTKWNT